ncbi:MAG: hypothetical protein NTX79_03355 [Candidatus Micrarchaeota archaeon]|nr:hypothetical protein [Candidatus Micrarchaeota archaeon]
MKKPAQDEFFAKERKKPYPSARKLARRSDLGHARRERKKKK